VYEGEREHGARKVSSELGTGEGAAVWTAAAGSVAGWKWNEGIVPSHLQSCSKAPEQCFHVFELF
jgi:hypothetical protein